MVSSRPTRTLAGGDRTAPRRRNPCAGLQGASLIEALLSLALASTLVAIAVPSLSHIATRQKVLEESTRIRLALEEAYLSALSHDSTVTVLFAENSLDFLLGEGPRFLHLTPAQGVAAKLKSAEQKRLIFYPTHTATPATVLVQKGNITCSIVVSLRGRIRSVCA